MEVLKWLDGNNTFFFSLHYFSFINKKYVDLSVLNATYV